MKKFANIAAKFFKLALKFAFFEFFGYLISSKFIDANTNNQILLGICIGILLFLVFDAWK